MSEESQPEVISEPVESKKRKPDVSLTDAKRQQLENARQAKLQKTLEKAKELEQMRSKLKDFEGKLQESHQKISDVEQKVTNVEVDKEVKAEISSPEKKAKIVTAEPTPEPKPKPTPIFFSELFNSDNVLRTGALVATAAASYYFKNVWRKEQPMLPPPPRPNNNNKPQSTPSAAPPPSPFPFPVNRPLSSLFTK